MSFSSLTSVAPAGGIFSFFYKSFTITAQRILHPVLRHQEYHLSRTATVSFARRHMLMRYHCCCHRTPLCGFVSIAQTPSPTDRWPISACSRASASLLGAGARLGPPPAARDGGAVGLRILPGEGRSARGRDARLRPLRPAPYTDLCRCFLKLHAKSACDGLPSTQGALARCETQ